MEIPLIEPAPEETNEEEIDETMLKKRPATRRGGKPKVVKEKILTYGDFVNILDFSQLESAVDYINRMIQKDRKRQKEVLPSFLRTATTNLRFELPEKAQEITHNTSQLDFFDPRLKKDNSTILKSLSQDLSLSFNPAMLDDANNKIPQSLKFTEVVKKMIKVMNEEYSTKISSKIDHTTFIKDFVNVPSQYEME
jgi:hypothetical protein